MKTLFTTIAVLIALSFTAAIALAKPANGTHPKTLKGSIVSVSGDGSNIVVETKGHKDQNGVAKTEQTTVAINASTTIEIDNAGGKHASDLLPGMKAKVKLESGVATDITARSKTHAKTHHKGKAPAAKTVK